MANFKTHIGAGVFLGIAFVVAGLIYSLFSGPELMIWIFLAVLVGSFLPDLDLDDGLPFQIVFGLMGASLAGLVFLNIYQAGERNLKYIFLVAGLVFVLARFGAGFIFKKFTSHRGMFHSIPAVILFGLISGWLLRYYSSFQGQELVLSLAVSVGYLGHLVLDEINSTIDFSGKSFFPKNSLGSALKLYSDSKITTLLFYILIAILTFNLSDLLNK